MTITRLPLTADPAAVQAALAESGLVVIESLVEGTVMDAVADDLRPYIDANPFGQGGFEGTLTRRTGSVMARSARFRTELAMHPVLVAAGEAVLGHGTTWRLSNVELVEIHPGQGGQELHRDQWKYDFFDFPPGYEVELDGMWAMTDFTEANGATRVIPGSHRWANDLRPTLD